MRLQDLITYTSRMCLILFCAIVLVATLNGCAEKPTFIPDANQEVVNHVATGIPFPFKHGEFTRAGHTQIEDTLSATYFFHRLDETVSIVVQVYPKGDVKISDEDEDIKQRVLATEEDPESRFIVTYDVPLGQGKELYTGKRSFFRVSDGAFMNTYLFEYGEYFVQYRARFPRDMERDAEKFLLEFKWTDEVIEN